MPTIHEYVRTMRQKPEHVRRRAAVGISAGVTALVAVLWAGTMVSTGAFALATPGDGQGTGAPAAQGSSDGFALSGTNVKSNFSQLMGAVNAATGATSTGPSLRIIDGTTTSSFDASTTNPSATVIPF